MECVGNSRYLKAPQTPLHNANRFAEALLERYLVLGSKSDLDSAGLGASGSRCV